MGFELFHEITLIYIELITVPRNCKVFLQLRDKRVLEPSWERR